MIAISTNRTEYRNDIAEEIRLFLGLAEIVLLEEIDLSNNKKIFICDKDGNMIGKSITPTTFVTNNLKLIKASIK